MKKDLIKQTERPEDYLVALKKCLKDFVPKSKIFKNKLWQHRMIVKLLNCEIDAINFYRQF